MGFLELIYSVTTINGPHDLLSQKEPTCKNSEAIIMGRKSWRERERARERETEGQNQQSKSIGSNSKAKKGKLQEH